MKKIINTYLSIVAITLLCIGCGQEDLSRGRNPRTIYALNSIEVEQQLELPEKLLKTVFYFWCTQSSSKYKFRLYYPEIPSSHTLEMEEEDRIRQKILDSLLGFKFELVEDASGKSVAMREVWSSAGRHNNSPTIGTRSVPAASMSLSTQVQLEKDKRYRIILTLPAKGDTEEMFLRPILAGGIAIRPSL
jgi:hypothetical protein